MKTPSEYRSRGHLILVKKIHPADRLTFTEIAEAVGVSHETVRQWFAGTSAPTEKHQRSLAAKFGIPVESWAQAVGGKPRRKRAA